MEKEQNAILETIDIIVKKRLKNLGFNYYVDGVVQDGVVQDNKLKSRSNGKNAYSVLINGTLYHDIPSMGKLDYCKGDVVQVLIKNGNWNKKFINGMSKHTKFPTAQQFNSIDKSGVEYPLICDNTTNLWIGALERKSRHHHGKTILSTGYDSNNKKGYDTAYVVVPNADNNDGETYDMLHSGNLDKIDNHLKTYFDNNLKSYMLNIVYPIGSIYMSVNNVSPATFLGGTWTSWGSGRVPVGVNTSDTNFSTVEKTGGASNVTLTTTQIPSHTHGTGGTNNFTTNAPASTKSVARSRVAIDTTSPYFAMTCNENADDYSGVSDIGETKQTGSTGGGSAHNNLQPYITCYMWKRTA